jgi:hypothetical protein
MSKAEPAILMALLGLVMATLAVRLTAGKYMSATMEVLDCRLGYYGLMSLASHYPRATVTEIEGWTLVNFRGGHFLFSKPGGQGHPMAVLRKVEEIQGRPKVTPEGCAFGDREAYKVAMTNLPPVQEVSLETADDPAPKTAQDRGEGR